MVASLNSVDSVISAHVGRQIISAHFPLKERHLLRIRQAVFKSRYKTKLLNSDLQSQNNELHSGNGASKLSPLQGEGGSVDPTQYYILPPTTLICSLIAKELFFIYKKTNAKSFNANHLRFIISELFKYLNLLQHLFFRFHF